MMMVHGCGLADEDPSVAYAVDFAEWGHDGVFEENMVLLVESYIGEQGAAEGVKLEEPLLIDHQGGGGETIQYAVARCSRGGVGAYARVSEALSALQQPSTKLPAGRLFVATLWQ